MYGWLPPFLKQREEQMAGVSEAVRTLSERLQEGRPAHGEEQG